MRLGRGFGFAQGVGEGGWDSFTHAQGVLAKRMLAMSLVDLELG